MPSSTMSVFDAPAIVARDGYTLVTSARCGQLITTASGCTLRVNRISYAIGTPEAAVIAHTAVPSEVTLTEDGRHYHQPAAWHEGPENGWVRVERWSADGMVFHGFIDSVSRKLLQTG